MKIKVTRNITYLEARKMVEQTPEITLSKIVQSAIAKPQTKNGSTQVEENDKIITSSSKVIWPSNMKSGKSQTSSQATTSKPKPATPKTIPVLQTSTSQEQKKKESQPKPSPRHTSPRISNFNNIDKTFTPNVPAWCINKPKLLFDLHSSKKSETSP